LLWKNCAPACDFFSSRCACVRGVDANGEAAAPRKSCGGTGIARPSRYCRESRMRRRIQSIWIESRSQMSIRPCGPGPRTLWSPVRQRTLRTPSAAAPRISACNPMRVRSRAATCMTGSIPWPSARTEHAREDIRGVADGLSVKLAASIQSRSSESVRTRSSGFTESGGATSAVTTNSPFASFSSSRETDGRSGGGCG